MKDKTEFLANMPAKIRAWRKSDKGSGPYIVFSLAVPVCTAYWDDESWARWVNWDHPTNAAALELAIGELEVKPCNTE